MAITSKLQGVDYYLVLPIAFLTLLSLVTLQSIDTTVRNDIEFSFASQLLATGLGLTALFLAARLSADTWYRLSLPLFIFTLGLLILVLFVGEVSGGATRWIRVGSFQFQPSELLKLALVLVQARLLARRGHALNRPWPLLLSLLYVAVPAGLIIAQPDVGTAVLVGLTWLALLFASELPKRTFVLLLGFALLVLPASYPFLADYQRERLDNFFSNSLDTQDAGYNTRQAAIAVGSGGFLGKGLDAGSQSQLNFLPAQHTDFIFAVIAEKLGFIGAMSVIIATVVLLFRFLVRAWRSHSQFGRLIGVGLVSTIGFQFVVNVGMNLDLLPVTGIPLPFVSGGGTHILSEFIFIGVFLSTSRSRPA